MSQEKDEFLERSKEFWNPAKTQDWQDMGVDLVIDRREDYFLYDMDGRRLIDVHLNGGTYNLGHRNPELVEALKAGHGPLRHRQPPFPVAGAHRAGREAGRLHARQTCNTPIFGQRRRRGDRHRPENRAARHQAAQDRLDHQGAITAIPAWRSRPATSASPSCSCSDDGRTSSSRCRSTTWRPWRRR